MQTADIIAKWHKLRRLDIKRTKAGLEDGKGTTHIIHRNLFIGHRFHRLIANVLCAGYGNDTFEDVTIHMLEAMAAEHDKWNS